MPNDKKVLGYVSSNTTDWSMLPNVGQKPCDFGAVSVSHTQLTYENLIIILC